MTSEYIKALKGSLNDIMRWRNNLPIIPLIDSFLPGRLIAYMDVEVDEAEEEVLGAEESDLTPEKLEKAYLKEALELGDVLVFLTSEVSRRGNIIEDKFFQAIIASNFSVNGAGFEPDFYQHLHWRVLKLDGDTNFINEAIQTLSLILSRLNVLSFKLSALNSTIVISLPKLVSQVIAKNEASRPSLERQGADYYLAKMKGGVELTPEQAIKKYFHVESLLRLLRKHFGSPLEPWMHLLVSDVISNWQSSLADEEKRVEAILEDFDQFLVAAILSGEFFNPDEVVVFDRSAVGEVVLQPTERMINYGLKTAGAVELM